MSRRANGRPLFLSAAFPRSTTSPSRPSSAISTSYSKCSGICTRSTSSERRSSTKPFISPSKRHATTSTPLSFLSLFFSPPLLQPATYYTLYTAQMAPSYWLYHYTLETGLRTVPSHLQISSWRDAFITAKYCPDLAPARFEARFHALLRSLHSWELHVYDLDGDRDTAVVTATPTQFITNRQSVWIRFAVPSWLKRGEGHQIVLGAKDRFYILHTVIGT